MEIVFSFFDFMKLKTIPRENLQQLLKLTLLKPTPEIKLISLKIKWGNWSEQNHPHLRCAWRERQKIGFFCKPKVQLKFRRKRSRGVNRSVHAGDSDENSFQARRSQKKVVNWKEVRWYKKDASYLHNHDNYMKDRRKTLKIRERLSWQLQQHRLEMNVLTSAFGIKLYLTK